MYRIGIDVGGTFTDGMCVDERGELREAKVRSTPEDPSIGMINCLNKLAYIYGMDVRNFLSSTGMIVHGTTIATNAIITGSIAKAGVITTKGFRDLLDLPAIPKPDMFNLKFGPWTFFSPRYVRVEVEERLDEKGRMLVPLNEADVRNAARKLKEAGAEAIAVSYLFSFFNSAHEDRTEQIVKQEIPEAYVYTSSKMLPVIGEWQRLTTTLLSACVGPIVEKYLVNLDRKLRDLGFTGTLLIMKNNSGVQSPEMTLRNPATIISSGPAAGPTAALAMGEIHGYENLIAIDMGGTSFDVTIIPNRTVPITTDYVIGWHACALPTVAVYSIGAGGGSIAWFDVAGSLRVGPQSAGAVPGPACYNMGGEKATVTDADVVLGYLNPDYFLGGTMKLHEDLAEKAIKKEVADKLGIDVIRAADAMYSIINAVMSDELTLRTVRAGYDPREFMLCIGGGAGPTHAVRLAEHLGIKEVLIPKIASGFCAFGMVNADLRHDYMQTYWRELKDVDYDELTKMYGKLEDDTVKTLRSEGIAEKDIILSRYMDVQYYGQFRTVEVEMPSGPVTKASLDTLIDRFHRKHKDVIGYSDPTYPVEFINIKLVAEGRVRRVTLKEVPSGEEKPQREALKGYREVYFKEFQDFVKTSIYDGDKLRFKNIVEGPAIIEETAITVVIPPKWKFTVDKYGNYKGLCR